MDLYYEEYAGHDIDAVITTRELIRMIRSAHISPQTLVDVESDRPMHEEPEPESSSVQPVELWSGLGSVCLYIKSSERPAGESYMQSRRRRRFNEK